jgi:hypothetical protein
MTDYVMIFPEKKMLFERLTTKNGDHWIQKSYNLYSGTVVVVIVKWLDLQLRMKSGRDAQHYVIKFVSSMRQVGGFLWVLRFTPPNETDHHNITEILLKVALNTIKPTNKPFL